MGVQGERTHEDDGMIFVFVLRQLGSRGEARHWPLALGWVGEDYRPTKPLHWVSEPWCGVPLVDCLVCVCPATREATRCHFARVCTCWWKRLNSKFHKDHLWSKPSTRLKGGIFFSFLCFPLSVFKSECRCAST